MAARLRKTHQDDVRTKIKIGNIIDRLEKHVAGEIELSSTQVASAKLLLDKTMSNAPTENTVEHGGQIEHNINVRPKLTREEWLKTLDD